MTAAHARRAVGALLLVACMLVWGTQTAWWAVSSIWIGFAAAAYLLTGEIFAIAFTAFMLALFQIFLGEEPRWLYLAITIAAGGLSAAILLRRFRTRIEETREARWKDR